MIDLGLSKIAIIGVVALIVIGPEKLPRVARMAGTLYGRAQRYLNQVKSEVSREIEMEELKNLQKEVQDAAQSVKQSVEKSMHGVENSISGNLAEVENAWRGDSSAYDGHHDAHEAMLRATNEVMPMLQSLPIGFSAAPAMWEIKCIGLVLIFVYAFFKFALFAIISSVFCHV